MKMTPANPAVGNWRSKGPEMLRHRKGAVGNFDRDGVWACGEIGLAVAGLNIVMKSR
jgi:hypothetical protein